MGQDLLWLRRNLLWLEFSIDIAPLLLIILVLAWPLHFLSILYEWWFLKQPEQLYTSLTKKLFLKARVLLCCLHPYESDKQLTYRLLLFQDYSQISFQQGAGFSLCISKHKNAAVLKIQSSVQDIMHGPCVSSHIVTFCHSILQSHKLPSLQP